MLNLSGLADVGENDRAHDFQGRTPVSETLKEQTKAQSAAYHAIRRYGTVSESVEARISALRRSLSDREADLRNLLAEYEATVEPTVQPIFEEGYRAIGTRKYKASVGRPGFVWSTFKGFLWPFLLMLVGALLVRAGVAASWFVVPFAFIAVRHAWRSIQAERGMRLTMFTAAIYWASLALAFATPFALALIAIPLWRAWVVATAPLREHFLTVPETLGIAGISVVPPTQPEWVLEMRRDLTETRVPAADRLVITSVADGAPRALSRNHVRFTRGSLSPGDVIVSIGMGIPEIAVFSWAPTKGVLAGSQIGKMPVIADSLDEIEAHFERNRKRLLPLLQLAARIHTVREPIAEERAELERLETQMRTVKDISRIWNDIYLPEEVVGRILTNLQLFVEDDPAAPSGMLLEGPPGTGKTLIAKKIAETGGVGFIATSLSDLKAGNVGGTEENVRALFDRARNMAPCIIFVDECEDCLPDVNSSDVDQFARAITTSFKAQWGGIHRSDRIWVIGATNHPKKIDSAIISRMRERIFVPLPNEAGRRGILAAQYAKMQIDLAITDAVVEASQGLSGRDLESVAMQARRAARMNNRTVTEGDVLAAISDVRGRDSVQVSVKATWANLVLDDTTLEELQTACDMLVNSEALKARGIEAPRGYLLKGPPGTGKTKIARTLANESGLSFYAPKPAEIIGNVVGATERNVANVFARARERAPVILFLDELDSLVPPRGSGTQFQDAAVNAILQEMEGVERQDARVFVLGATNRPDRVDPAILSRLSEVITVGLPNEDQRRRILDIEIGSMPLETTDRYALLATLASRTEGLAGRDLRSIVEKAQRLALRRARSEGDITKVTVTEADLAAAIA